MSTTTAHSPKIALVEQLRDTCETYLSDLAWIPADKLGAIPMGKARPPLEFTTECAGFNNFVAALAEGTPNTPRTPEERKAHYASIDSLDKARTELQTSVDRLTGALDKLDDDGLFQSAKTPWDTEATIFKLATMCASHMSYHDGQLNYIQALYGDEANHWG